LCLSVLITLIDPELQPAQTYKPHGE